VGIYGGIAYLDMIEYRTCRGCTYAIYRDCTQEGRGVAPSPLSMPNRWLKT
jgi:hypothetical protein